MDALKLNGQNSFFDTKITSEINSESSYSQQKNKPSLNAEDITNIIDNLNHSLGQLNTTLRFSVDNDSNVFYVAVIDTKTDEMLRRFPVEELPSSAAIHRNASGVFLNTKG